MTTLFYIYLRRGRIFVKRVYDSVAETVGETPLLRLKNTAERLGLFARVYAKAEWFNPTGSVKDRVALAMIEDAERRGILTAGSTIIEPTSGNTGIGLAMVAACRGYKVIIVMPESMSVERRRMISALGARVVLTDGALGMRGAIAEAERLANLIPNSFIPEQFSNPANPEIHRMTTGPEIYSALDGRVDIFVAGVGTGGSITGIGGYLKSVCPSVRVVAVEPLESQVIRGGTPGAHSLQGIGAGFIPDVLDKSLIDDIIAVGGDEAFAAARLIALCEGILVGISSGAALHAALLLAKKSENLGKNIVVLLPDGGEKYLSTPIFG